MSDDDDNVWKWNEFLEIGNTIHKMSRALAQENAQVAYNFSNDLVRSKYVTNSRERYMLYKTLLPKISAYLDGKQEMIMSATREYFIAQHSKAGHDQETLEITFGGKKSGIQTGLTCQVEVEVGGKKQITFYFIKTHQHGPTVDNPKSVNPPDAKELFLYKLLHRIGIGPEVHFIVPYHGTTRTIYIATKDCKLQPLSKLTSANVNLNSLLQLDLISRILCLRDCTTNSSNCGLYGDSPMIVDFRIEKPSHGYLKPDIVEKFIEGNHEFHYTGLMADAVRLPRDEKLLILKKSMETWNLLDNVDKTWLEVNQLVQKIATKIQVDDDLERYVKDVKVIIGILLQV